VGKRKSTTKFGLKKENLWETENLPRNWFKNKSCGKHRKFTAKIDLKKKKCGKRRKITIKTGLIKKTCGKHRKFTMYDLFNKVKRV